MFQHNEKLFYRNLSATNAPNINGVPDAEELKRYWSNIWSNTENYNQNALWLPEIENENLTQMTNQEITSELVTSSIKKTHNWKSPGSDGIQNFWYKKFSCVHELLTHHFNDFINHPENIPPFLLEGITILLPKDSDTQNPAKYRPITCLQTVYKILTSCISNLLIQHLNLNGVISQEQKGCAAGSKGCKEQLIIDSIILRQRQKSNRNLYTMYIDYKKAFDSVPHSWLIKILELYKIDTKIVQFLSHIMNLWNTRLQTKIDDTTITTDPIQIRRGIFQGDSLSPIWFCIALNPLSTLLNKSEIGFKINGGENLSYKINHLMYMDDIKLYASSKNHLHRLFEIVKTFTNDINMEFGIDKCKTQNLSKSNTETIGFELEEGTIEPLQDNELYKYLGFKQSKLLAHIEIKKELTSKFKHRLNMICNSQLNSKNVTKAINTFAIPVLTYSFGIIKWAKTDIENLNRTIRTTLKKHRKHHPRSAIERVTLPRSNGGRGLIDIKNLWYKQLHQLREYFTQKAETMPLHHVLVNADKTLTPLNLYDPSFKPDELMTVDEEKYINWSTKSLHGRHFNDLNQNHVDSLGSNQWLQKGDLFPETEGFMLAIQDQVIMTRNYQKYILRENICTDLCRKCKRCSETIQHITSGCSSLAQYDYLERHNEVSKTLHQELALKHKLISNHTPYYKYIPEVVLENEEFKMYFDRTIYTDRSVHHNRPDITLISKKEKMGYFIDIAIPNNNNVQGTHEEKIRKYNELRIEVKRIWQLKEIIIVPIIISSTGIIPKLLHNSLKTLEIHSKFFILLQKIVILNTCRIVRKFLDA